MDDATGSKVIAILEGSLGRPGAPFMLERADKSLRIVPLAPGTFEIGVEDDGAEAIVHALTWHDSFDDPEQAGGCVMGMLTPYYRVVEYLDKGQPVWSGSTCPSIAEP